MTTLPEATPTNATPETYMEVYGPPLIVFNIPDGLRYEWYPRRNETMPHVVRNAYHDGTRTAAQAMVDQELRF